MGGEGVGRVTRGGGVGWASGRTRGGGVYTAREGGWGRVTHEEWGEGCGVYATRDGGGVWVTREGWGVLDTRGGGVGGHTRKGGGVEGTGEGWGRGGVIREGGGGTGGVIHERGWGSKVVTWR